MEGGEGGGQQRRVSVSGSHCQCKCDALLGEEGGGEGAMKNHAPERRDEERCGAEKRKCGPGGREVMRIGLVRVEEKVERSRPRRREEGKGGWIMSVVDDDAAMVK